MELGGFLFAIYSSGDILCLVVVKRDKTEDHHPLSEPHVNAHESDRFYWLEFITELFMERLLKLASLFLVFMVVAQTANSSDSRVTPNSFSESLKTGFESCSAFGHAELIIGSYDWSSVEECSSSYKENIIEDYKKLRSTQELSDEAVRSLKSLVAYWQASMDALSPGGTPHKAQYSKLVNDKKSGLLEKINLFLLDVM